MTSHDDSSTRSGPARHVTLGVDEARPVVRLVDLMILEALRSGSQQVHFSTGTTAVRFFRLGAWTEVMKLPPQVMKPLINRIRVMTGLDRTKGHTRREKTLEVQDQGEAAQIRVVVQFTEADDEEVYLHMATSEQK